MRHDDSIQLRMSEGRNSNDTHEYTFQTLIHCIHLVILYNLLLKSDSINILYIIKEKNRDKYLYI